MNKKSLIFLYITLFLGFFAGLLSYKNFKRTQPEYIHAFLQNRFLEKDSMLNVYIDSIIKDENIQNIHSLLNFCKKNKINEEEYVFYIYDDDTLKAWSSNIVNLPSVIDKRTARMSAYQKLYTNKIFLRQCTLNSKRVIGMYVLSIPYENKISFCNLGIFNSNKSGSILINPQISNNYVIKDKDGKAVFSLDMNEVIQESDFMSFLETLLWLAVFTMFIYFADSVLRSSKKIKYSPNLICTILTILSLIYLYLTIGLKFPFPANTANLFSSIYYASLFKSLGELSIGAYIFLTIAIILFKNRSFEENGKFPIWVKSIFCLTIVDVLFFVIFYSFSHMVANTSSSVLPTFSSQNPIENNESILLKIIYLLSLISIMCSITIISEKYYHECKKILKTNKNLIIAAICSASVTLLLMFTIDKNKNILFYDRCIIFVLFVTSCIIHITNTKKRFTFRYYLTSCLLTSILLSSIIESSNSERLEFSKKSFAKSLLDQDPLLRYQLLDISKNLNDDNKWKEINSDSSITKEIARTYIQEHYISQIENVRKKLFIGRTSVASDKILINQYKNTFKKSKRNSIYKNIVLTKDENVKNSKYLLLQDFPCVFREKYDTVYVALEIESASDFFKPIYLLNRKEHRLENETVGLSCAEYDNGILSFYYRDFKGLYLLNISDYKLDTIYNGMSFKQNNYEYSLYFENPKKIVMIATPQSHLKKSLSMFTYIFFVAFIYNVLLSLLLNYNTHFRFLTFKQRIQILIIFMVVLTSLSGSLMFTAFSQNFNKTELFQNSLQHIDLIMKFLPTENINPDSSNTPYLENNLLPSLYLLPKDQIENINIYNLKGEALLSLDKNLPTSQSSLRLNPKVIEEISTNKKTFYRDCENINSKFEANILYKPIRNSKGEILAYCSFPSQQKGGYIELLFSSFIPTFFVVYMFITILFILFGTLITKYITLSLTNVAKMLSEVKLKSNNKKISWKYEDEIGLIIQDYNRLIDDLEYSAELLARSERESAWKELAQQVAHEIRNPLTPMKLSTQQLQKHIKNKQLDDTQLMKYTKMMINQIDVLSDIAKNFSCLAKIHQTKGKKENLVEIIENSINMFENFEDFQIDSYCENNIKEADVLIERQQLLQIFNNLINNAIQAKKPNHKQIIEIHVSEKDKEFWKINIKDYGKGMSEETIKKAFMPHFTTKSNGTGLGLTITKSILDNWGGNISCESIENEYTIFTMTLPKYKKNAEKSE